MAVSDKLMRKNLHFFNNRTGAEQSAKLRQGVVIQYIRGRQWGVATGTAVIREALKRARESLSYMGKSPPKIVKDFRR